MDILWSRMMMEVREAKEHMATQFVSATEMVKPVHRSRLQTKLARQFLRLAVRLDPSLQTSAPTSLFAPPSAT